jgi:ElaB/YqjD/DUF883 family membrane-anchored ribosome-binding protein
VKKEKVMSETKPKNIEGTTDFAADLAALREDIARISASLVDLLHDKTTSSVLDAVDGAKQKFSDKAAEAQNKVNSISNDLESAIERNPLVAVLLAALAGFIIGTLSRSHK